MFGPSGVSIAHDRSELGVRPRTSKPARSRVKPPGPNAEIRRLCVISDGGAYSDPQTVITGLTKILWQQQKSVLRWSYLVALMHQDRPKTDALLTARSTRTRPTRNGFISPQNKYDGYLRISSTLPYHYGYQRFFHYQWFSWHAEPSTSSRLTNVESYDYSRKIITIFRRIVLK